MVVEEERDEETSQLWILRHLRLLLNDVEDSVLSSFILHQDCTPLRNFVNGYGRRRVLYIDVKRSEAPRRLSSLQPLSTTTDNEQKAWRAPAPLTIKKGHTLSKRISSQQELEPTKEEEVALNAEKSEHLREVEERAPEVALRWYDTQLPAGSNEFVFIVTKTQSSINFGFDQLFQVGICHSGQVYWRMIELATNILGCEADEYVKVDLLLLFVDAGFR
ncbi:unnamed protein product [Toxocara canis]|uniref:MULE domain-containing protein n=1 Tax=Toxocara canis TaxID=6265 RepID=A0A183V1F4_TOXCA|nr:unnamed protein product [Toxocara canis]